jgi:hypothetical protein
VIFQSTSAGVSETTPISATTQIPAPSPTPGSGSGFHLVIAVQKDESVFMMNQGTIDLPLNLIQLGTDQGKVLGEEWKVDLLMPGQCVGVWKEGSLPFPPANIKCKIVGEQLKRSGSSSFWKSEFNVYYHDLLVGTCNKDQAVCEFIFPNTP